MTPAQINRELLKHKNPGNCCIFTVVNGPYVWYLPMFVYLLKKAYPEYSLHILADTEDTEILSLDGVKKMEPIVGNDSGYRAACRRFLHSDKILESFDYCLITDCDMMIIRESITIVDQHMLDLRKNDLECYSNYTSNGNKCPGIHFVTKDWWTKTKEARKSEAEKISSSNTIEWDYDEKMLRRIIIDSDLPTPPDIANLWTYHGEHLGDWRRRIQNKDRNQACYNSTAVDVILSDKEFIRIASHCHQNAPQLLINECLQRMRNR